MILFEPETFLAQLLGSKFFKQKLLTSENEIKKEELRALVVATGLSKRTVDATVYKIIDLYEKKMQTLKKEGVRAYRSQAVNNEALLKQRLQDLVLYNEVQHLKEEYAGRWYRWLPSSSKEPDPEHQLLYGKIFKVGKGDKNGNMPSERYGCKCGMQILTNAEYKRLKQKEK